MAEIISQSGSYGKTWTQSKSVATSGSVADSSTEALTYTASVPGNGCVQLTRALYRVSTVHGGVFGGGMEAVWPG